MSFGLHLYAFLLCIYLEVDLMRRFMYDYDFFVDFELFRNVLFNFQNLENFLVIFLNDF